MVDTQGRLEIQFFGTYSPGEIFWRDYVSFLTGLGLNSYMSDQGY